MSIEDETLRAAIAEAEQVQLAMERANARTAAAAWWSSKVVLERFLALPDCFDSDGDTPPQPPSC